MFWASDAVNEWNDQFSPQKVLKSPRKAKQSQDEDPSTPRANKLQSPVKANLKAKKDFDATKQDLAESFLAELDQRITNNKVAELTASTGGVKLIWSKTLTTTAGRANWRRERSTKPSTKADKSTDLQASSDDTSATTTKDHASIELSTKIITDAPRLLNVIAHEFCHLANFLVTGIKDRPHGAEFQRWGRLCTAAFAARGVHVTTKHSYEIEYKYLWRCSGEDCDQEFQRHSRSIDVKRHKCGRCKSTLVQIRPVPRGSAAAGASGGTGNEAAAKGGYAAYVKKHFAEVKAGLPAGSNQKDVMVALGQKYRAEKAESQMTNDTATVSVEGDGDEVEVFVDEANDGAVQVDDLINELEIVTLGDE
jgi:predicted SprT family Zn-dependent metalloprotease